MAGISPDACFYMQKEKLQEIRKKQVQGIKEMHLLLKDWQKPAKTKVYDTTYDRTRKSQAGQGGGGQENRTY